jgi:hypothetical protein
MKNSVKKIKNTSLLGNWGAFRLLLLLPLVVFLGASCTLIDALKPVPTALPPETQTGANTFGCLVDGKLLVPYSDDSNLEALSKELQSPYGGLFGISCGFYKSGSSKQSLGFLIRRIQKEGIYKLYYNHQEYLTNGINTKDGAEYRIDDNYYNMKVSKSSLTVEITKFDQKNYIVAGRFYGTLYDEQDSTRKVEITQGRFDVKFQ